MKTRPLALSLALALWAGAAPAQGPMMDSTAEICEQEDASCVPPPVVREFRGLWIASVGNIDWPSRPGLSPDSARRELTRLLDRAKSSGLNAVIFQVRPQGDALYASEIEPWSEFLSGTEGVAPNPWWDPLRFAVDEAHKRGLELHAWFNPYRARHTSAKSAHSRGHMRLARPSLVRQYGSQEWMDPGELAVRQHTIRVILDVVKRYDIDGVHIDDYFYPYKERDRRGRIIEFPDDRSFQRYQRSGGTLNRDDWRRENVNTLVKELYERIHAEKPWVKFGVSPFGIWRPGFPEAVRGFDAYSELYADARKWLQEGWLDYFSPQLYWPVQQRGQEYPVLLRWWSEQNAFGRHLWPGNFTSKVGEASRTAWSTNEIEHQIRVTRAEAGASGNVHFSAKVFLEDRDSLATRLSRHVYDETALVPASPWMRVVRQGLPNVELRRAANGVLTARLTATRPVATDSSARSGATNSAAGAAPIPRWWLVQTRRGDGTWESTVLRGNAREITVPATTDRLAVRALDHAAIEGPPVVLRLR